MGVESVTLRDSRTGATARIATSFGFNCFDFSIQRGGKTVPLLWTADDFEAGTARPSGSGIPLLFPFPGRIQGTTLRWEGREYQLREGDGRGNAIHGFVLNRPWRVVEQSDHHLVGEFQASRDDSALLQSWPADFCIRVAYTLHGETLASVIRVTNPDTRPLPCGLGTHAYFRVPLGGSRAEDCLVRIPVTEQWDLRDMITTGTRSPLPQADALRRGAPFGDLQFDNVFTGIVRDQGWATSSIHDPQSGIVFSQRFDAQFRECVVYTPGHRQAICVEPLTCVPGCFDLTARGIDAGLRVLPPGGSFEARIDLEVTAASAGAPVR